MAGQLKIGGNIIATHAGSEGAGTVTLDSSTLTIGSNTTVQGTFNGTMGASATFQNNTILQTKVGTYSSEHSTSSTSWTSPASTSFQVLITPSSNTNKILVTAYMEVEAQTDQSGICCDFYRDHSGASAESFLIANSDSGQGAGHFRADSNGDRTLVAYSFLDSPGTTNEITYRPSIRRTGGSGSVYIGPGSTGKNTIVAQEIKA
jgi:hypothetical protein